GGAGAGAAERTGPSRMSAAICRLCSTPLRHTVVDLGTTPLCESYVSAAAYNEPEAFYPLHALVCGVCYLVQIEQLVSPESVFAEYAYFSSYSDTWVAHARGFASAARQRFGLTVQHFVVELGSNDGYLLQHFAADGIPVLGVDPAANVAAAARDRHLDTDVAFFGLTVARRLAARRRADLIVANNVLAQVPDLHDFVAGIALLLAPAGVVTIEVPHVLRLLEGNQFDTIYHEHFSYFSLHAAERLFAHHDLRCFDVEELTTHGGSLRLYLCHGTDPMQRDTAAVAGLRRRERDAGLLRLDTYAGFAARARETKRRLLEFLIDAARRGHRIAGYGAPGKGNTLLNYCGVGTDFIAYTVDRNPYKQGKYLPGSRIPVYAPERIAETKPDYLFILPWNLKDEIIEQMSFIRAWGGRFVVPIPEPQVIA
ncbi:MAG: methyltransferase domain-containing protein, partial [Candidatus Binatia bacterium]